MHGVRGRREARVIIAGAALVLSGGLVAPALAAPAVAPTAKPSGLATHGPAAMPALRPKPGWVHWTGRFYSCWIPSDAWQVVESNAGITISSPTGDNYVDFGWSGWMQPVSTQYVLDMAFGNMLHPLIGYRVLGTTGPQPIPQGQREIVQWSGTWNHQLKGRQSARGYVIADAMDYGGSYGFSAYVVAGPTATWKRNVTTLETIRQNIVFMGNG